MASSYTSSYQLCQWEAADKVLRTDFNGDNQKIDAALAGLAEELEEGFAGQAATLASHTARSWRPRGKGHRKAAALGDGEWEHQHSSPFPCPVLLGGLDVRICDGGGHHGMAEM